MSNHANEESSFLYERDGFFIGADVFTEQEAEEAYTAALEVLSGKYDLEGEPAWGRFKLEHVGTRLVKVNDAHVANRTLRNIVTSPKLGEWAAAVTGARMIQVWSCQKKCSLKTPSCGNPVTKLLVTAFFRDKLLGANPLD